MVDPQLFYWDADVFLSYINRYPERLPTIETILDEISKRDKDKIVTSILSKVEVAWAAIEKLNRVLSNEEEKRIDDLWNDSSVIELIDLNDEIAINARGLMRKGMLIGEKRLRTNDAIHLASAVWVGALEFNTYNLKDYSFFIEVVEVRIREPFADQLRFF